jgi:hypothetical protein
MSEDILRVIPSKLNLFNNAKINEVVEMGFDEEYFPIGFNKSDKDPVHFFYRGSEHWIDLGQSYVELELKFDGTDGASSPKDFKNATSAGFVNDIGNSIFSTISIKVNDSPVSITTEQYGYVAYIQNLLNYAYDYARMCGRPYLWNKDNSGKLDTLSDSAYTKRKEWVGSDNKLNGIMRIRSPLFTMPHYLMSFLNLDIVMDRQTNANYYMLQGSTGTFSIVIESAVLKVRKLKLLPSFVNGFENFLRTQTQYIEYPLTNSDIIVKTYSGIGTSLIEDNLFHGAIPSRIVCGFVGNSAFSGDRSKNPYNFSNVGITEVSINVNGLAYPRSAITCDFESGGNYVNLYHCFLSSLQSTSTTNTNAVNLSYDEYGSGFTLFSFDMSPDQYGNVNQNMFNTPANVQLKFKLKAGTTGATTLIVYHESISRLVVNSARQVQVFSK